MTTISHKNLSGSQLHENKGASAATDDTVATVTSGATVWKKLTSANLASSANPFGAGLFHVQDQRVNGVGGGTNVLSAWTARVLNTVMTNEITSATLTSNQISLPAGTYFVMGRSPGSYLTSHKSRLRNVTDSSTILTGSAMGQSNAAHGAITNDSILQGRFTLAGTKTLAFEYFMTGGSYVNGLGIPISGSTEIELYADILFWKVG